MRIMAVSLVKNEADIIESFVRHTLGFVDRLFIADHSSTDGTYEILQQLCAEGLPITLTRIYNLEYRQSEYTNAQAKQAVAAGAELILPLDADEFLVSTTDTPVREVLDGLDSTCIYYYPLVRCDLATPECDADRFILARAARMEVASEYASKTIVGVQAYSGEPQLEIAQGNHHCLYVGTAERVEQTAVPGLMLLHYAFRSNGQRISKIAVGWLMNVARYGKNTMKAVHWGWGFDRLLAGEGALDDRLDNSEPMTYSGYPVPQLKYTSAAGVDYLANILRAGVELAQTIHDRDTLAAGKVVSIVVPYLGEVAPFRQTVASVAAQLYPYTELIILALAPLPPELASVPGKVITVDGAGGYRDALAGAVSGEYVKLLPPGRLLDPRSITRELGYLLAERGSTLAMQVGERRARGLVEFSEQLKDTASVYSPEQADEIVRALLNYGAMPVGGMGGVLMTRDLAVALGFFVDYMLAGRLMEYSLILDAIRLNGRRGADLHLLRASYCRRLGESATDILWQQLEWYTQLMECALSSEDRRPIAARYLKRSQEIANIEAVENNPLYADYTCTVQAVTNALLTGEWK